jgi:L-asparaginase
MKHITINPSLPQKPRASVFVIYTGGTLGMVYENGELVPFNFREILDKLPEIKRLDFEITFTSLETVIDSSNITPEIWVELATVIYQNYRDYDSFVILHGTDTMAYTASAMSFMLKNNHKPIVITGAQLPIGVARTDARENIITALEIAAAQIDGRPIVPEVCIYFQNVLLRGNRAKKVESSQFNAFQSENYPALAEVGITIEYNFPYIKKHEANTVLCLHNQLDTNIIVIRLFPGMKREVLHSMLQVSGLKAVIIETYGSGNAPTFSWFIDELKTVIDRGIIILNVSQCQGGRVVQGHYQTSTSLQEMGVISGNDMTIEAATIKLMHLLANYDDPSQISQLLRTSIAGELT